MHTFVFLILLLINVVYSENIELISPIFGQNSFKNTIINYIRDSNSSVKATIYKLDDDEIIQSFQNAGEKGVVFDLICDTDIYKKCLTFNTYGNIKQFDMKLYTKLHAKSLLIDNSILILGLFNMDKSAFTNNIELGVIIRDRYTINNYNNFIQKVKE
jgi:phosphatidylserine/phosphatidylglycerophosphate/cardiolipin synthase-like enzyme